jgi:hypothetical protein
MRRLSLLHPLLFAVAPILFLVAHNVDQVELDEVGGALVAAVAAAAVLFALFALLLRERTRAALATSLTAAVFYAYGRLFDVVWDLDWFTRSRDLLLALGIGSAIVLGLGLVALRRTRRDLGGLSAALSLGSVLFLAMNSVDIGKALTETEPAPKAPEQKARPAPILEERADLPDIYFIVLDGYARADKLREIYGYDNTPFLDGLRKRGFWVGEHTRSDYMMTHLSLASTLSMRYLDGDLKKTRKSSKSRRVPYKLLRNNAAAAALQRRGYRYVHFDTNYGGTERSDIADIHYSLRSPWLSSEFMSVLLRTTALRPLEPAISDAHLYMLRQVQEVPNLTGPTFTFLHLLMPHNPYVFDKDGNVRADIPMTLQFEERTGGWGGKAEYLGQLEYLNRRVLEIVDRLVADSPNPPIIILESDHGSATRYHDHLEPDDKLAFWDERSANLSAWYAPAAVRAQLPDDLVSVNTFRILFSALWGEDLPPLEKHVWASWYARPNTFEDVAALVDPVVEADPAVVGAGDGAAGTVGDVEGSKAE